ncbi:MAG: hypothetical protein Q4C50_02895 [Eubacteriales bacterium]|nr:hypothetical protein [Eubacteriales bacterium]
MHFYTSVNINYLPKARILAKSVKEYCKDSVFSLIFSDQWPEEINPKAEPFDEIITIDKLGIPVGNLDFWIYTHTVVELCTAVKGQALVNFLENGSDKVVYLDPDIAVFNDLHELEQMLDRYSVILTPHVTIQEKEKAAIMDNEICALKHGAYNFGFYAVKNDENGCAFAKWWRDRLLDFCFDDIPNGIFTDQKWGDLAPCLFENIYITRDPGYNVSTWNISNRTISKTKEGIYLVNGVPLKFYHFSGFDSGAQADMLGLYAKGNKCLYELRKWYIKRQEEEEQDKYAQYPSKYNFYDNGEKITKDERELLRKRLDVLEYFESTNPYKVEQTKSYYRWYRAEIAADSGDKTDMEKLREENTRLKTELYQIYGSKSWKIVHALAQSKFGKWLYTIYRRE